MEPATAVMHRRVLDVLESATMYRPFVTAMPDIPDDDRGAEYWHEVEREFIQIAREIADARMQAAFLITSPDIHDQVRENHQEWFKDRESGIKLFCFQKRTGQPF